MGKVKAKKHTHTDSGIRCLVYHEGESQCAQCSKCYEWYKP